MNSCLYQNTIKYSEPEKTNGPSGVIPIASKTESNVDSSITMYLAFIIRNLFLKLK